MRRHVIVVLLAGLTVSACGHIDRSEYARDNARAFHSVPAPPAATLVSTGVRENAEENHLTGYWTDKMYRVHGKRPVRRIIRFYRVALPRRGWKAAGLSSYRLNYRKDDALVHVFAYGRTVEVSVDHDCCW